MSNSRKGELSTYLLSPDAENEDIELSIRISSDLLKIQEFIVFLNRFKIISQPEKLPEAKKYVELFKDINLLSSNLVEEIEKFLQSSNIDTQAVFVNLFILQNEVDLSFRYNFLNNLTTLVMKNIYENILEYSKFKKQLSFIEKNLNISKTEKIFRWSSSIGTGIGLAGNIFSVAISITDDIIAKYVFGLISIFVSILLIASAKEKYNTKDIEIIESTNRYKVKLNKSIAGDVMIKLSLYHLLLDEDMLSRRLNLLKLKYPLAEVILKHKLMLLTEQDFNLQAAETKLKHAISIEPLSELIVDHLTPFFMPVKRSMYARMFKQDNWEPIEGFLGGFGTFYLLPKFLLDLGGINKIGDSSLAFSLVLLSTVTFFNGFIAYQKWSYSCKQDNLNKEISKVKKELKTEVIQYKIKMIQYHQRTKDEVKNLRNQVEEILKINYKATPAIIHSFSEAHTRFNETLSEEMLMSQINKEKKSRTSDIEKEDHTLKFR